MSGPVYLEGVLISDGQHISLPLSSCAVLLVSNYCHPIPIQLVFVKDKNCFNTDHYVTISAKGIIKETCKFTDVSLLPEHIHNVLLPATYECELGLVRSGLCVILRHIIKMADEMAPEQHLKDLLGFRQGSLRMCAEVSGWTKLCEVDLPFSIGSLTNQITSLLSVKETGCRAELKLPQDLGKLEAHFAKPPRVHNDDRLRRQEVAELQTDTFDLDLLTNCRIENSHFLLEKVTELHHGVRKYRIEKKFANLVPQSGKEMSAGVDLMHVNGSSSLLDKDIHKQLTTLLSSLTFQDIQLVHLYSEGVEMTVADICLFAYLYVLLEALLFDSSTLMCHIPRVLSWLHHLTTISRLQAAAIACGLDIFKLKSSLECDKSFNYVHVTFTPPSMKDMNEDEMELSRRCRTKHKAIKPEVIDAIQKMKAYGIEPVTSKHPRGTNVQLDWQNMPSAVHPLEGEVPLKRVERKCQQLENLVTAVHEVAKPGDTIVDFCSGGGHLGIALAYTLPHCKVYLVENKDESLLRAKNRMESLNLTNAFLYQCNLDYFVGKFSVGVSLHACGSATDMVLHQCLASSAAFVICPCCYGSIQRTHLLSYPQSQMYQKKNVTYTEFLTLGHAADQTEFNIALEQQGRLCMNLVDTDRAELARESGYTVTLCSLYPQNCSPKNNLLIGQKLPALES